MGSEMCIRDSAKGLRVGQQVDLGDAVGTLVPWGTRTHLHYSVHLTGNTKSQRARKDSNAIDPLTLVQRLRERAYALNDRDGDSLSSLLRDAQHRAVLIEAARDEPDTLREVSTERDLAFGVGPPDGTVIGILDEAVDEVIAEVSGETLAFEPDETADVALVSSGSVTSSTDGQDTEEDEAPAASAGITFSLSRNGSLRLGSQARESEPEEPTETISLEALVTLFQNR